MASSDGTTEIVLGILMTLVGFGSIFLDLPFYCCGFAIFGPILFIVGLVKALRGPARPTYVPAYYPPPYYPAPGAPPPPPAAPPGAPIAPAAQAPFPPVTAGARKRCGTCGGDNRDDAKFCTSCGAPF